MTVMLAAQREVVSAPFPEFQPRREGGVEGGEGGGGAWWGASLPALGESLPLPSPWSPRQQDLPPWFMRTFICLRFSC